MRDDTGQHAIQLKHGGDFDEKRGNVCGSGVCHSSWTCTDAGYFDVICPTNKECRVILPVEVAFEEVGSGTIWGTVDKDDASLGSAIVYFDTLEYQGSRDESTQTKGITYEVVRPCN